MRAERIRVLIVEDSAVVRELLKRIIAADPRLEVAAVAGTAEEALSMLDRIGPDVISLDIRLPGMQGIEATRRIMATRPTPIVVVSGAGSEEGGLTMEALRAGALSVVEKPAGASYPEYAALAARICTQLAIMSEVKVVRQHIRVEAPMPKPACFGERGPYRVLGLVASTGGPSALMQVLTGLGLDFPLPIIIVQHITPTFLEAFGAWLEKSTGFKVEIVNEKTPLLRGRVYLAPAARHVMADGYCTWTSDGEPVSCQRPSGSVLFQSLARYIGGGGIGVLLTGMGEDGAAGLLDLRRAGGYTIAESESSAVVYGMPGAAVRIGAACETLPLAAIPRRVLNLVKAGSKEF